jgi:hypothetical protein
MFIITTNIRDIVFINGFVNNIKKPTHFDNRRGNYSLLDPILITDSISTIDSEPIHIDRELTDHDETYVTIGCGFSNNKNYKRKIWDYKRADYHSMNITCTSYYIDPVCFKYVLFHKKIICSFIIPNFTY